MGTEEFYNKDGRYCVLGLKAHEAGIKDDTLLEMGNSPRH